MTTISEAEFDRISSGIFDEREKIFEHNPIGTRDEVLLWMLLGCLVSYLNVAENEAPCFPGRPHTQTYRDAISFVLKDRRTDDFDAEIYIDKLLKQ